MVKKKQKKKPWKWQEDADMCTGEFFWMNDEAIRAIATPGT